MADRMELIGRRLALPEHPEPVVNPIADPKPAKLLPLSRPWETLVDEPEWEAMPQGQYLTVHVPGQHSVVVECVDNRNPAGWPARIKSKLIMNQGMSVVYVGHMYRASVMVRYYRARIRGRPGMCALFFCYHALDPAKTTTASATTW